MSVASDFFDLLLVAIIAVAGPMVAELVPGRLVPPVVLEVVAGIALGPQGLGWVRVNEPIDVLSLIGLSFLLFLAGTEVDPRRLGTAMGRRGLLAYLVALAVSVPLALVLRVAGAHGDLRILALSLTSTSLGILVPVLHDSGESHSEFGQAVLVYGSVAEFASLLVLTVMFSADPEPTSIQILYVVVLGVSAVIMVFLVRLWWRSRWFTAALRRMDETTSQLRVRSAFVILLLFASLVARFGVDSILGAFVAGIVLKTANEDDPNEERYMAKLNAVGYGFVVPVFFIATGLELNVRAMVSDVRTIVLIPLILVALAVSRGLVTFAFTRRRFTARTALAAGAFQSTSLTFAIVASTIGLSLGFLSPGTAAALVAAGLASVILFPAAALALRPWTERAGDGPEGRRRRHPA